MLTSRRGARLFQDLLSDHASSPELCAQALTALAEGLSSKREGDVEDAAVNGAVQSHLGAALACLEAGAPKVRLGAVALVRREHIGVERAVERQ